MAKFDAASAVEEMEWDFTTFAGKTARGVVPEPTTGQVEEYFNGLRNLVLQMKSEIKEKTGLDVENLKNVKEEDLAEETIKAMTNMGESMLSEQQAGLAELTAKVCSEKPNSEQLMKLPYRVFSEFQKWLMGELRPNSQATGTKR